MIDDTGLMSIAEAGALRVRHGYRAVMVVSVRDDDTVDVMSHTRDRRDCKMIGDYAKN